jgi:hypothetical protein
MSAEAVPTFAQYAAQRGAVSDRVATFRLEIAKAKNVHEVRAAHDALWAGCR